MFVNDAGRRRDVQREGVMSRMRVRTRDAGWLALGERAIETVFWFSYLFVSITRALRGCIQQGIKSCKPSFHLAHSIWPSTGKQ